MKYVNSVNYMTRTNKEISIPFFAHIIIGTEVNVVGEIVGKEMSIVYVPNLQMSLSVPNDYLEEAEAKESTEGNSNKRYEYNEIIIASSVVPISTLEEFGKDGWEFVHRGKVPDHLGYQLIFKREKKDDR